MAQNSQKTVRWARSQRKVDGALDVKDRPCPNSSEVDTFSK